MAQPAHSRRRRSRDHDQACRYTAQHRLIRDGIMYWLATSRTFVTIDFLVPLRDRWVVAQEWCRRSVRRVQWTTAPATSHRRTGDVGQCRYGCREQLDHRHGLWQAAARNQCRALARGSPAGGSCAPPRRLPSQAPSTLAPKVGTRLDTDAAHFMVLSDIVATVTLSAPSLPPTAPSSVVSSGSGQVTECQPCTCHRAARRV